MDVDIGYAWEQLERARQMAAEHADADVRARARESVAKWESVIAGMQTGAITVGARTPTSAPAWVTLDVATGGFATGRFSAGGELRPHEHALAKHLGLPASRLALNLHFLAAATLGELLASGRYRIDVPEEGALLVVAWLRRQGDHARAEEIVRAIGPWFEQLRFYPIPAERALDEKETVRLQDVSATLKTIAVDRRQPQFEIMRDALRVWKPMRIRAIALFVERAAPGPDWGERVAQLRAELGRAGEATTLRARETAILIARLARCAKDPHALSAAEEHEVERTVARHVTVRDAKLADDQRAVAAPLHADLRRVLVERLRALPADGAVELAQTCAPVTDAEAAQVGVPAGSALPAYLADKAARSCDASLAELVERGVIASSEVFARVLPQVTSHVRAQAITDIDARRLYTALYTAFRRRRGLLLLNYQHQVRFTDLPWVAALEQARETTAEATARARTAVATTSGLALRAFPYTIVPNKLVTELSSFTVAAELQLPLVEELAADIFMGSFTRKFVAAAHVSARLLERTLYQRYFAIDVAELARVPLPKEKEPSEAFAAICRRRAGTSGSSTASNGMIIEQAQILTTHNLAVLFDALPLREELGKQLLPIAETCFLWATRRLHMRSHTWHDVLIGLKNAAYAWRQMLFYLSFCSASATVGFARRFRAHVERADDDFRDRFEPALRGLALACEGVASDHPAFALGGGRVFTGWSTERHWLAPLERI